MLGDVKVMLIYTQDFISSGCPILHNGESIKPAKDCLFRQGYEDFLEVDHQWVDPPTVQILI